MLEPLGAEAAGHTRAEEPPEVQEPLLEKATHDAGPGNPAWLKGTSSQAVA